MPSSSTCITEDCLHTFNCDNSDNSGTPIPATILCFFELFLSRSRDSGIYFAPVSHLALKVK